MSNIPVDISSTNISIIVGALGALAADKTDQHERTTLLNARAVLVAVEKQRTKASIALDAMQADRVLFQNDDAKFREAIRSVGLFVAQTIAPSEASGT